MGETADEQDVAPAGGGRGAPKSAKPKAGTAAAEAEGSMPPTVIASSAEG